MKSKRLRAKEEDRLGSRAHPPHPGERIRCVSHFGVRQHLSNEAHSLTSVQSRDMVHIDRNKSICSCLTGRLGLASCYHLV